MPCLLVIGCLVIDCGFLFMRHEMTLDMRDVLVRKMQNADLPRILQLLADDELGQLRETLQSDSA